MCTPITRNWYNLLTGYACCSRSCYSADRPPEADRVTANTVVESFTLPMKRALGTRIWDPLDTA